MAFDPFEEYITDRQQDILEGLFVNSNQYYNIEVEELASLEKEYFDNIGGLTFDRAQEIIDYLNENKMVTDLDTIFNQRFL